MRYIILLFSLLVFPNVWGQAPILIGDSLPCGCSGLFQDSGGSSNDYLNNEDITSVLCPDFCTTNRTGTHTQLTFSGLDLKDGDVLRFYNGNNIAAPLILEASDRLNDYPFIVQATAINSTGCLTVQFKSNGTNTGEGWNAAIQCIPSCQLIQSELISTNPASDSPENGYINVCIGENISFTGRGLYPEADMVYNHSDATSTFEWDLGDGTIKNGMQINHAYQESGGYKVELTITDQFGCQSSNFITQRVRVSTKPSFIIQDNFPSTVCVGDSILLRGGVLSDSDSSNISVAPTKGFFQSMGTRADSLPLPDGNGRSYETSVSFNDFSPGQVLTDVKDLESICLNMEHSWLHDMEISLTCPNGKSIILQQQDLINDEVFLGLPNDQDGVNPMGGIGKDYCWTPDATFGTLTDVASRDNDSGIGEPYYLPSGNYKSSTPLTNLIGCPLNGEWTIKVTDLWEQDNGWIFSWGISFDAALFPDLEFFEPPIVSIQWQDDPTIIEKIPVNNPHTVLAIPDTPDEAKAYYFQTEDEYGCISDTSIQVQILAPNHPECLTCDSHLFFQKDVIACEGEALQLGAYIAPQALGAISFEQHPEQSFFLGKDLVDTFTVSGLSGTIIGSNLEEFISICLDIETASTEAITLRLRGPNGQVITLSDQNGDADSQDFFNTCFSPLAKDRIQDGVGPFEGVFLPENDWSTLVGETLNGQWVLVATSTSTMPSVIKNWTMSFKGSSDSSFSWESPLTNLNTSIGANPLLTARANTEPFYVLTKTQSNGCVTTDTLFIQLLPTDINLDINYYFVENGEILFYWDPVPDASSYEISRDGVTWRPTDNEFFHREFGFNNGEESTILFRAVYSNSFCKTATEPVFFRYLFCDLEISLLAPIPEISCFGEENRSATIIVQGGDAPYTFILNDSLSQADPTFTNLGAGDYEVLVNDKDGICADTLNFTIGTQDSLGISFEVTMPKCFDSQDGSIVATPFGGVGGYTYEWMTIANTNRIVENLNEGTYQLKVSDANDCTIIDTVSIVAPTQIELTATQDPISCNGQADGAAGVKAIGGTPISNLDPYNYQWEDGQTSASAIGLRPGNYAVTVSDKNACTEETVAAITEPLPLAITFEVDSISCTGEEDARIIAKGTGGTPHEQAESYEYRWSNEQVGRHNFLLGEGNYTLTITDAQGCVYAKSQTITPPKTLSITPIAIAPPLCNGQASGKASISVSGGAGNYTYVWDDPIQQTSNELTNVLAGAYAVSVMDDAGCVDSLSITIEEKPVLTTVQNGTIASCHDRADGMLSLTGQNGLVPYSYRWEDGQITSVRSNLLPGKYPFTITDSNNCSRPDTAIVFAPDTLIFADLITRPPNCLNDANGIINATMAGGTAPYTFRLDDIPIQNPITDAIEGKFVLEAQDSKGCMAFASFELISPPDLNFDIEIQQVACFGESSGQAAVIPFGGTPPYSYRWSDGKNENDSIATDLAIGMYSVSLEDANNCVTSNNIKINQPEEALSIAVEQTKLGCFNSDGSEALITATGGTGSNYSYNWSDQKGTTDLGEELSAKTYFLTVTDENNCIAESSISIRELDSIAVEISSSNPSCHNIDNGKLAVITISGGLGESDPDQYRFRWSNNGTSQIIENLAGDTNYRLTVTDFNNCSSTFERFLQGQEEITLNSRVDSLNCFKDQSGKITIQGTSNGSELVDYEWGPHSGSAQGGSLTNLTTGSYRVTATNESGCKIEDTFVIEEPNLLVLSETVVPNLCANTNEGRINLNMEGGSLPYSYNWSTGATSKDLMNVPSGNYLVTISDANNCTKTEAFDLIDPPSITGILEKEDVICFDDNNGRLDIQSTGGTPPYSYSINSKDYQPSNTFIGLSSSNYTAYIKDVNGCIWQEGIAIKQPAAFSINIVANTDVLILGDATTLDIDYQNNQGAVQFDWTSSSPLDIDCLQENCERIRTIPQSSTKFEVYAVDEAGCEAEADLFLRTTNPKKVLVPSGFSPNNDGFNDLLLVHGQSNIEVLYFRIFDRWGEEIYAANNFFVNDPMIGWDGTFKGQRLNGGIFTWIMEVRYLDQQTEIFKGNTTLLK